MDRLPLFPLGTALLPGAPLGLQVFEPRYVALLHHLLGRDLGDATGDDTGDDLDDATRRDEPDPVFGVVGIRKGYEVGDAIRDTHDVGCTARITRLGLIGTGVFGLLAHGERRFHLRGIDEAAGTPYLTGLVEWLDEPVGDEARAAALAPRVVAAVHEQLATQGMELEDPAPTDPTTVSWWAPRAVDLDTEEVQRLLAAPDTATRLGLVLRMTTRETSLADRLGTVIARRPAPPPANLN